MIDGFSNAQLAWCAVVFFIAYTVRGMSGFGAGLVAVPLLAFVVPLNVAVPLASLTVFILFIFLFIRDRREVLWPELRLLAPPTLIGVVVGLLLFASLDNRLLMLGLGVFLMIYASYMLAVDGFGLPSYRFSRRWARPVGFFGSFFDTLFGGGGGTLVVIYLNSRGITRTAFRATVAALWFMEMIVRVSGYALSGYYTKKVLLLTLLLLPVMWIATRIGERIGNVLSPAVFSRVLAALLFASGVSLLVK